MSPSCPASLPGSESRRPRLHVQPSRRRHRPRTRHCVSRHPITRAGGGAAGGLASAARRMRIAVSNPSGFLPARSGGKTTPPRRQPDPGTLRRTAGREPGRETGYDHTWRRNRAEQSCHR